MTSITLRVQEHPAQDRPDQIGGYVYVWPTETTAEQIQAVKDNSLYLQAATQLLLRGTLDQATRFRLFGEFKDALVLP